MPAPPVFKTRARVLNQLGGQLIKNESIALLELIKNSYDADASECTVKMYNPESIESGKIVIIDDGEGMDYETLSTVWLEIGTSYKEDLAGTVNNQRSKKYRRLRLGEKGIGRFGAHRLGKEITIVTRKSGAEEAVLSINWDDIDKSVFIEDLPVAVFRRTPKTFVNGTGTKIIIKRFRSPWTRKMARDCARTIMSLNSPFEDKSSFRSTFEIVNSTWLKGIMSFADVNRYKLFSFDVTIIGDELTDFTYEFCPWDTMKKLNYRKVVLSDPEMKALSRMQYKDGRDYKDIDLGNYKIGEVKFKGIIFDRDTRTLSLGVQDKKGLKDYLDVNGGVRVFRDNMRVLDYGEPGNDWLDLGGRRINMPTKRISNNIILGAVFLKRDESQDLIEQANREGFVEDGAYWELLRAIRFAIDRVESLRKTDKDLLRKHYGPQVSSEPVITSISELKDVVERKVKEESTRTEICRYLDRIETEYDAITDSLMRSAGAGLNLIVVVHQIEKIIKEIKAMLQSKAERDIIENRVQGLSKLVEGYSILVKKSEKKIRNIKGVIEQCVFNIGFRLDAHNIALEPLFRKRTKNLDAICSEDHMLNALMNIIDNSIWWLGYSRTRNPSILIDISDQFPGHVCIVIADNGPGFTKPTDQIIKPFVSDKPGGMGIGLHLTHQIMESLGGELLFPDLDLFDLPKKYEKGAIIALAFKKGGK